LKYKRTIKITSPRLRKIRNNLREVLHLAESSEMDDLLDQRANIQKSTNFWDECHPQYQEMRKEVQDLASRASELSSAFKASIVICPVCMRIDRDMTYNPILKKWYCVECYEDNRKFQIRQGQPELYP